MIIEIKTILAFIRKGATLSFCILLAFALLMAASACSNQSGLKHKYNERITIHCRILGPVDENILSFTEKVIVTSFVPIEILEPKSLSETSAKLILQRNEMRLYPRIAVGQVWREVGSNQTIEVVVNKDSGEVFLYPSLNIPKSKLNF
jgi:hypothetical protein